MPRHEQSQPSFAGKAQKAEAQGNVSLDEITFAITALWKLMEHLDQAIREAGASAFVMFASSHDANMRYLSRFQTGDPVVFIKRVGEAGSLIVSQMEYERASREANTAVITRADAGFFELLEEVHNPWTATARMIAGYVGGDILVPAAFPYGLAYELQQLCRVSVDTRTVESIRAVKSEWEIGEIKRVQRAANTVMEHAVSMISGSRPKDGVLFLGGEPLTSVRVRRAMHKCLMDMGCRAKETIISCGEETALPHRTGEGSLYEDEPIVIDIFPQDEISGYFSDMTRTVVKGTPSQEIEEMYEAVAEAKKIGSAMIADEVSGADVHQRVVEYFVERGYKSDTEGFIHNLGHGVGLSVHEEPSLGPRGGELASGNVITVEPGLYYRGIGGVRLEDIGEVRKGGFSVFTEFPEVLSI